jgi:RHS repeat-associated protein
MAFATSTGQNVQAFKYNDKELDLMHNLNMYDYSARYIDMANPRFTTIDPLAEKYYSVSPYAYCLNNPVRYIDLNGREVRIFGDEEFKKQTFEALQKLTSSSLLMLKNGKVVDASSYSGSKKNLALTGEGSGDKKEFGTSMMSDLISSKHTISIKEGSENSHDKYTTDAFSQNGEAGKGSGAEVQYNATDRRNDISNADGTTGRPPHIGLAHELIHGWHAVTGTMKKVTGRFRSNPDMSGPGVIDTKGISGEEYVTRVQENIIRKEQKVKQRKIPTN